MKTGKLSGSEYRRHYMRVYNHLDYYLKQVLGPAPNYLMENVVFNLEQETGIRFRKKTLEKYLKKCIDEHGVAPLMTLYHLDVRYYGYSGIDVKPPKIIKKCKTSKKESNAP